MGYGDTCKDTEASCVHRRFPYLASEAVQSADPPVHRLKEHVREVRPLFLPGRTYQRTVYVPGELAQCDLWEPREEIPVGFGQHRKGYVVTCTLGYSKVGAGTLDAAAPTKRAPHQHPSEARGVSALHAGCV